MQILTTDQPVKINVYTFSTYEEYRTTYIEIWERLHPTLVVDEDWILRDWNQRVKDQNAK